MKAKFKRLRETLRESCHKMIVVRNLTDSNRIRSITSSTGTTTALLVQKRSEHGRIACVNNRGKIYSRSDILVSQHKNSQRIKFEANQG